MEFRVDGFEGPLDLLLHLIKENKMDIFDIEINLITEQYLKYINNLEKVNLEISEYLVLASELIEIKAKMLLPKKKQEMEIEEEDPREELVNKLLEYEWKIDGVKLEVILSNNGSDKNVEGYEKLKNINDGRFHYYEFEQNMRFWRNYNEVIMKSNGDWCLLLSDEDELILDNIEPYINIIKNNLNLAIIKCGGDDYPYENEKYAIQGREAVEEFFLIGNYLSGVMYNRKIVNNELIKMLADKYSNSNEAYYFYPHMFVDLYALIRGDFFRSNVKLEKKGKSIDDQEKSNSQIFDMSAYSTIESRLKQYSGFLKLVNDIDAKEGIKFLCYKKVIDKYIFLEQLYKITLRNNICNYMVNELDKTNVPSVNAQKSDFSMYIEEMLNEYF